MTAGQSVVLWLGVGLELLGIGLALIDTRHVQRAFQQRFGRVHLRGAGDITVTGEGVVTNPDRQPSLEERVGRLEHEVDEIRREIGERVRALHVTMQDEMRSEAQSIRSDLDFQVQDLRRLLGVGVAPNRRRTIGLILFAVGLVLQSGSNYLA